MSTEQNDTKANRRHLSGLVRGMSQKDVESAILLVSRIGQDAAYGRDPDLCKAANLVLGKLRECANTQG